MDLRNYNAFYKYDRVFSTTKDTKFTKGLFSRVLILILCVLRVLRGLLEALGRVPLEIKLYRILFMFSRFDQNFLGEAPSEDITFIICRNDHLALVVVGNDFNYIIRSQPH